MEDQKQQIAGLWSRVPREWQDGAHGDGITGRKLAEAGVWDLSTGVINVGRQPNLALSYVELQRDMENHGIRSAQLLRRFLWLAGEINDIAATSSTEAQFVSRARSELAVRTGEAGATGTVARLMGVSPRQFRRRFHALTGSTPQRYLLQVRMSHAEHLLSFCSVKETAARLGYSDPFVFSRQFKRTFGISPSEAQSRPD